MSSEPADFAAIKNYFQGDRIKQIPARMQKRRLLARWLAERFELGRTYTEKAVNEIIERYHPDFATLRREMIDNGFMRRKDGVYWREPEA
jgi:hypothetical protein